jgi:hypothetical protein
VFMYFFFVKACFLIFTFCLSCTFLFLFNNFFIRLSLLCRGIHSDNSDEAYIVHWLNHPYSLSPSTFSLAHLKQLQEVSLFCCIYEVHQLYTLILISFIYPSPPTSTPPHTMYLFYSPN